MPASGALCFLQVGLKPQGHMPLVLEWEVHVTAVAVDQLLWQTRHHVLNDLFRRLPAGGVVGEDEEVAVVVRHLRDARPHGPVFFPPASQDCDDPVGRPLQRAEHSFQCLRCVGTVHNDTEVLSLINDLTAARDDLHGFNPRHDAYERHLEGQACGHGCQDVVHIVTAQQGADDLQPAQGRAHNDFTFPDVEFEALSPNCGILVFDCIRDVGHTLCGFDD
mmetsp:Transcript_2520/g.4256  ORF Transcript_2520/g.4256 Transcript_2520/m.4256 type:complete len:220 (-) Transcript_2520:1521-2180(-)